MRLIVLFRFDIVFFGDSFWTELSKEIELSRKDLVF